MVSVALVLLFLVIIFHNLDIREMQHSNVLGKNSATTKKWPKIKAFYQDYCCCC